MSSESGRYRGYQGYNKKTVKSKMIKIATIERKRANKAIKEAEQVCDFFRQKIYSNTATYEEREHYMELLKFRISGISSMIDIIPQLAAKIE